MKMIVWRGGVAVRQRVYLPLKVCAHDPTGKNLTQR